jgi:hypothetical protein
MLLAVAAVHALLLTWVLQSPLPPALLEAADAARGQSTSARLSVELLEPVSPVPTEPELRLAVELPRLELDPPEALNVELEPEEASPQERLQGMYLGQVRARIERAWQAAAAAGSPRSLSTCGVTLTQTPTGTVLEVAFDDCPADVATQSRLEQIIRGASPLPAAPSAVAFSPEISLTLALVPPPAPAPTSR